MPRTKKSNTHGAGRRLAQLKISDAEKYDSDEKSDWVVLRREVRQAEKGMYLFVGLITRECSWLLRMINLYK